MSTKMESIAEMFVDFLQEGLRVTVHL